MSYRGKLLAGVSVGALVATPEIALAMDGAKWGSHVELGGKFGEDRQIGSADFFMPLWQDQFSLLFADVRGRFDNDDSLEGNFGLGYRKQINKDWIVGGYAFYDVKESEFDNKFNQFMAGFEAMSEDWEVRVNGYLPEDDVKPVSGAGGGGGTSSVRITGTTIQLVTPGIGAAEQAFYGGDVEVGLKLPLFEDGDDSKEFRVFAGGFHFDSDQAVQQIAGPRGRAELRMYDVLGNGSRFVVGGEIQRDDVRGTEAYGTVQIRVPLQSDKTKRLTGLDRRMLNTVQRDVDIVSNLIPGRSELVEDVIIDLQGFETNTIVFADKYGDPEGEGTVTDPTTLENAQYALGKNEQGTVVPGIIVINDDDDGERSGKLGITLKPNQALIGGNVPVVLTGAESGRSVNYSFAGDTNNNGTLLEADVDHDSGAFIRLANNNEVAGFGIYTFDSSKADIGINAEKYRGVNNATIRDMRIYNMKKAGINLLSAGTGDRNFRIDNVLIDSYSGSTTSRRNLGRGINIEASDSSLQSAAGDGIFDVGVSITNSRVYSGGKSAGVGVLAFAQNGSMATDIDISRNTVANIAREVYVNKGYGYFRTYSDDAIQVDQILAGENGQESADFNTIFNDNTIGGGRRGIDLKSGAYNAGSLTNNVEAERNTLYGLKDGINIDVKQRSYNISQVFGNANYTRKGPHQTAIGGVIDVSNNIFARPNYNDGPNSIYGVGIDIRQRFGGAPVIGTANTPGQIVNVRNNNLVGVRGQLIDVSTDVYATNTSLLNHGDNQENQTDRLNSNALAFVNQQVNVTGNTNTYVPNKHKAPNGVGVYGGIDVNLFVGGGISNDAGELPDMFSLVDARQSVNVFDNDVTDINSRPLYNYYGSQVTTTIPIRGIKLRGGSNAGIQVGVYGRQSTKSGGAQQQVQVAQDVDIGGNTVNDVKYFGNFFGGPEDAPQYNGPGTGRGIDIGAYARHGATVMQTGDANENEITNVFGSGIAVGAFADAVTYSSKHENSPSHVNQQLNLHDNMIEHVIGSTYVPEDIKYADRSILSAGIALRTTAGGGQNSTDNPGDAPSIYQSIDIGGTNGTRIEGASDVGIASINAVRGEAFTIDRRLNVENTIIDGVLTAPGNQTYCPDYGCTDTGIASLDVFGKYSTKGSISGRTTIDDVMMSNIRGNGVYNGLVAFGGYGNSQYVSITDTVIDGGANPTYGPLKVGEGPFADGTGIHVYGSAKVIGHIADQSTIVRRNTINNFSDAGVEIGLAAYGEGKINNQYADISMNDGGEGFGIYNIRGAGVSLHATAGEGGNIVERNINVSSNDIGYTGLLGVFDSVASTGSGRIGTTNTTLEDNNIVNVDGFGVFIHSTTDRMNGDQVHNVALLGNTITDIYGLNDGGDNFQPGTHVEQYVGPAVDFFSGEGFSQFRGGTGVVALHTFYGKNKDGSANSFNQNIYSYNNTIADFAAHGTFLGQRGTGENRDGTGNDLPRTPFNFTQTFTTGGGYGVNTVTQGFGEGRDLAAQQYGNGKQIGNGVPSNSGGYNCYQQNDGQSNLQDVCDLPDE